MPDIIRSYRGSKIFTYSDPLSLDAIHDILASIDGIVREEPDRDLAGSKKTITSRVNINNVLPDIGLMGTVYFEKQELDKQYDEHYMTTTPLDFFFCQDPSVLIIHGSRGMMDKVIDGLERALHYDNDPKQPNRRNPEESPEPFFTPYGSSNPFNKYVVKKIVKQMEAQNTRNILYDPHFQQLRDNADIRGGECFWRRDGVSASQDERFCYLFELCTFWEPELLISTCGGISSLTASDRIKVTINSDFSFTFSKFIRKEELDVFWNSLILNILRENNYEEEMTECVQPARDYEARIRTSR